MFGALFSATDSSPQPQIAYLNLQLEEYRRQGVPATIAIIFDGEGGMPTVDVLPLKNLIDEELPIPE
jgi:hypothetical protein